MSGEMCDVSYVKPDTSSASMDILDASAAAGVGAGRDVTVSSSQLHSRPQSLLPMQPSANRLFAWLSYAEVLALATTLSQSFASALSQSLATSAVTTAVIAAATTDTNAKAHDTQCMTGSEARNDTPSTAAAQPTARDQVHCVAVCAPASPALALLTVAMSLSPPTLSPNAAKLYGAAKLPGAARLPETCFVPHWVPWDATLSQSHPPCCSPQAVQSQSQSQSQSRCQAQSQSPTVARGCKCPHSPELAYLRSLTLTGAVSAVALPAGAALRLLRCHCYDSSFRKRSVNRCSDDNAVFVLPRVVLLLDVDSEDHDACATHNNNACTVNAVHVLASSRGVTVLSMRSLLSSKLAAATSNVAASGLTTASVASIAAATESSGDPASRINTAAESLHAVLPTSGTSGSAPRGVMVTRAGFLWSVAPHLCKNTWNNSVAVGGDDSAVGNVAVLNGDSGLEPDDASAPPPVCLLHDPLSHYNGQSALFRALARGGRVALYCPDAAASCSSTRAHVDHGSPGVHGGVLSDSATASTGGLVGLSLWAHCAALAPSSLFAVPRIWEDLLHRARTFALQQQQLDTTSHTTNGANHAANRAHRAVSDRAVYRGANAAAALTLACARARLLARRALGMRLSEAATGSAPVPATLRAALSLVLGSGDARRAWAAAAVPLRESFGTTETGTVSSGDRGLLLGGNDPDGGARATEARLRPLSAQSDSNAVAALVSAVLEREGDVGELMLRSRGRSAGYLCLDSTKTSESNTDFSRNAADTTDSCVDDSAVACDKWAGWHATGDIARVGAAFPDGRRPLIILGRISAAVRTRAGEFVAVDAAEAAVAAAVVPAPAAALLLAPRSDGGSRSSDHSGMRGEASDGQRLVLALWLSPEWRRAAERALNDLQIWLQHTSRNLNAFCAGSSITESDENATVTLDAVGAALAELDSESSQPTWPLQSLLLQRAAATDAATALTAASAPNTGGSDSASNVINSGVTATRAADSCLMLPPARLACALSHPVAAPRVSHALPAALRMLPLSVTATLALPPLTGSGKLARAPATVAALAAAHWPLLAHGGAATTVKLHRDDEPFALFAATAEEATGCPAELLLREPRTPLRALGVDSFALQRLRAVITSAERLSAGLTRTAREVAAVSGAVARVMSAPEASLQCLWRLGYWGDDRVQRGSQSRESCGETNAGTAAFSSFASDAAVPDNTHDAIISMNSPVTGTGNATTTTASDVVDNGASVVDNDALVMPFPFPCCQQWTPPPLTALLASVLSFAELQALNINKPVDIVLSTVSSGPLAPWLCCPSPRAVLTGVTGSVGGALLGALLRLAAVTNAPLAVTALVRCSGNGSGDNDNGDNDKLVYSHAALSRLESALVKARFMAPTDCILTHTDANARAEWKNSVESDAGACGWWVCRRAFTAHVSAVAADVSRPWFGLPRSQWRALAAVTTAVFHCAASVDHAAPAWDPELRAANAAACVTVAALAASARALRSQPTTAAATGTATASVSGSEVSSEIACAACTYHISTTDTVDPSSPSLAPYALPTHCDRHSALQSDDVPNFAHVSTTAASALSGYAATKLLGERALVACARAYALPLLVLSPGHISVARGGLTFRRDPDTGLPVLTALADRGPRALRPRAIALDLPHRALAETLRTGLAPPLPRRDLHWAPSSNSGNSRESQNYVIESSVPMLFKLSAVPLDWLGCAIALAAARHSAVLGGDDDSTSSDLRKSCNGDSNSHTMGSWFDAQPRYLPRHMNYLVTPRNITYDNLKTAPVPLSVSVEMLAAHKSNGRRVMLTPLFPENTRFLARALAHTRTRVPTSAHSLPAVRAAAALEDWLEPALRAGAASPLQPYVSRLAARLEPTVSASANASMPVESAVALAPFTCPVSADSAAALARAGVAAAPATAAEAERDAESVASTGAATDPAPYRLGEQGWGHALEVLADTFNIDLFCE